MTILYKLDSKGKIREWEITVIIPVDEEPAVIQIVHGLQDGKKQTKNRFVKSGKNKGRANETTITEQAKLEADSLIQSQLDSGYVRDISNYEVPRRPQLAFKYSEKAHTLDWNNKSYSASKKLNGIRCFVFIKDGKVIKYQSRTGKDFKQFPHITNDIEKALSLLDKSITNSCIFDGELFHPTMPFEYIASNTNSLDYNTNTDDNGTVWTTDQLQLHCYDFINLNEEKQNYTDRFINLNLKSFPYFVKVENVSVPSVTDLQQLALQWIEEGYEGLMLRDNSVAYDFGKRTKYLLKYKIMLQDEFLIKDVYIAENDDQKVMFLLENKFNKEQQYSTFDCALKGSKSLNMMYFNNKAQYIDKAYLTVDYQVLSQYSVPLFPVGVIVREGTIKDGVFIPST